METPPLKYFISALWANCISTSTHLHTLFAVSVCRCFLHVVSENSVGRSLSGHINNTYWHMNIKSKYDIETIFVTVSLSLVRCSRINTLPTINSLAAIPAKRYMVCRNLRAVSYKFNNTAYQDKYFALLCHILCELCYVEFSFWALHHMGSRAWPHWLSQFSSWEGFKIMN
jgi:hypothetical protein